MNWDDLIASLDRCVVSLVSEEDADAEEADKDRAVTELNHKLIELHSRIKALEDEDETGN